MLALLTVTTNQDVVDLDDGVLSLREAIFVANTVQGPDTIEFDFGHDGPETIVLTEGELVITDSLVIDGFDASLLTIDAQSRSRVFNITATTGDCSIVSLRLTGGRTTGGGDASAGGAIRSVTSGQLTVRECIIEDNRVEGERADGGGMFSQGLVLVEDCIVRRNSASGLDGDGGGIRTNDVVRLVRSVVADNRTAGMDAEGGGINSLNGAQIVDSVIRGNSTAGLSAAGGGVFVRFGMLDVENSVIEDNRTSGLGLTYGGGLAARFSDLSISGSLVRGNSSRTGGGGIWSGGSLEVSNSTISSNAATNSSNVASGGGILSLGASLETAIAVKDSTIAGNFADNLGGGFYTDGPISFVGALIADNTSGTSNPDLRTALISSVRYSFVGDTTGMTAAQVDALAAGPGNITNQVPLLGPLGYNGGPVFADGTRMLTHALLAGSPAIDAGDPAAVAGMDGVPEFDQRGTPHLRVLDGDAAESIAIDIGAYEREFGETYTFVVDTIVDESDGDYSLGDFSLREATLLANANPGADVIEFDPALWAAGPATILLTMGELQITNSLTIDGPGAELLAIDASGNDPTPNSTLDDGDDTNDGDGSRVLNVDDGLGSSDLDISVRGLTLTGGDSGMSGGAIRSLSAIELIDSVISGNDAFDGGGVYSDARVSLTRSSIVDNRSFDDGGGILANGDVALVDSHVDRNQAVAPDLTALGGGIVALGEVSLVRSSVSANSSFGNGGGMRVFGAVSLVDSEVIGNRNIANFASGGGMLASGHIEVYRSVISANESQGTGGGIRSLDGVTITESLVSNNKSRGAGGGLMADGNIDVFGSTISGNSAIEGGGGIFLSGQGALSIVDSTVSNNSTGRIGGGVYHAATPTIGGHTSIVRSTITKNVASRGGGAIIVGHETSISHSIIAGNFGDVNPDLQWNGPSPLELTFSLIGDNTGTSLLEAPVGSPDANGNLVGGPPNGVIDPQLGPLVYNGGPVFADGTRMLTHAPLPGSPVIDAGDLSAVTGMDGVPEFDQRGMPWGRVANGDDVPEARIDMGAIEWQLNPLPGDYNFNGVVDGADYSVWRDTLGSTTDLRADGSSESTPGAPDGVVDEHDYAWWKANFGNVLQVGSGAIVAGSERQAADENSTAGQFRHGELLASSGAYVQLRTQRNVYAPRPPVLPGVASVLGSYLMMGPSTGELDAGISPADPEAGYPAGAGGRVEMASINRDAALVAWEARRGGGNAGLDSTICGLMDENAEEDVGGEALEEAFAGLGEGGLPAR